MANEISMGIIEPLNEWLYANGFVTTCKYVEDGVLQYNPATDEIYIPTEYDDEPDTLFMKCFRKLGLKKKFKGFTMSILHELGHAKTLDLFTEEESAKCDDIKREYQATLNEDSDDYYLEYWKVKDEYAANSWAVMYANCFPKKVKKLAKIIEENVNFG